MSRTAFPFAANDISALARSLRDQWDARADTPQDRPRDVSQGAPQGGAQNTPSHVELLNMLARASGFRNFQHFRAQAVARARLEQPAPEPVAEAPVDLVRVHRVIRVFNHRGIMTRWPPKASERALCLWVLWARFPSRTALTERAVNDRLNLWHGFGDHALLRRELCDSGLMTRTRDGREYRRVERRPPAEALALIHYVGRARDLVAQAPGTETLPA
ncbi:DUF2087 domain-containing protein [Roseospira marina]|uniref:DUF2087 domain-containing protein n=1 Tax=Roseospira marina TaxID=140057 RepID=A0A5M6IBC8_9PROT|nr:DUF2087 domain-containing protein [Roseospira marina]KAA5605604.1 DUF2087 domain-containing protein [Roseospira marina]MBB4313328.1 hypothetical protein [Roseospira marina]MBB5085931.1 hypothetical protein [Roseospira marina]